MALETEGKRLNEATVTQGVRAKILDTESGYYMVAVNNSKIVGCILVQYEWSDWRNARVLWLHSAYVLKEFRGQGIFRKFYAAALETARESGACGIRLYVEKDNHSAQKLYSDLGMTETHYKIFEANLDHTKV